MSVTDRPRGLAQAWRVLGWMGVAAVIVLSLVPALPTFTGLAQEDKVGHVLAYAALTLWFAQVHRARGRRALTALGLIAMGIALEFAQSWIGQRTFSVADMSADAIGVALGWLAAPPRGPDLMASVGRMLTDRR